MFECKDVLLIYAISPIHMGAGTAIGAIDNPIQRERHTDHPMLAGSGLKGAMRDVWKHETLSADVVFGPEASDKASDHAGALSIGDAQLVLFPVRSLRDAYVYATCPTAMGRLARSLAIGDKPCNLPIERPDDETAHIVTNAKTPLAGNSGKVILETFAFKPTESQHVTRWAQTIATLLPDTVGAYFKEKVQKNLVLLSDTRFAYFVRNATVVEPHVRIDDATGTADDGGLFYTENVPPEALFASLVMTSKVRKKGMETPADEVLQAVREQFGKKMVQIGGDATSGRGQVIVSFAGGQ